MDFIHTVIVDVLQAVLTLSGGGILAFLTWKLKRRAEAVPPATTRAVDTASAPVPPTPVDPDIGPRLAWKDARITELEHQIDRERLEHTEELASRNRLIANLRDELVLASIRTPHEGYTQTAQERNAEQRTDASQRIVADDSGAGIGDGGFLHGERDGKEQEDK